MKVALAQINPTVGDFSGNAAKMLDAARRAAALGAELAVFPEMSIMGYPPRDLVEHAGFVAAGLEALDRLARELPLPAVVGFVARNETGEGKPLHNSAAFIRDGRIASVHHKSLLPTYDVFDEDRYFEPGRRPHVAAFGGRALGITICEDCWRIQSSLRARYRFDPLPVLLREGAQVILNLSASPFTLGKQEVRRKLLADQARRLKLPIVYVNQVGGNDELVFDGGSMVLNARGELVALAKQFEEDLLVVDLDALPAAIAMPSEQPRRGRVPRAGARHARLPSQMRVPVGGARAERRD